MKKFVVLLAVLPLLISLFACGGSDMPMGGSLEFHELTLTVPDGFIRDSTQSNVDFWVFEKGFYSQMILLSRKDISGDVETSLDAYAESMGEVGTSVRGTFLACESVCSAYEKDGVLCQEVLFAYEGSFYALALRGGTQADFEAFMGTVKID